ncbi:MAG: aldo/keto reductase [Acetobacteraceae bacterium]
MTTWEKRRVGRTDLHVTSLGLGTATMGGSRGTNDDRGTGEAGGCRVERGRALCRHRARSMAFGAAERATGDALRDKPRDEWVLSTKCGGCCGRMPVVAGATDGRLAPLPFAVQYDYSYDGIMRSIEDSYQRLGLAKIDILLVHDIGVYQHGEGSQRRAHEGAARQRLSRARGTEAQRRDQRDRARGVNEKAVLIDVLGWGDWDAFLLAGPLYAAGAGAARRPAADVRDARHLDHRGRGR